MTGSNRGTNTSTGTSTGISIGIGAVLVLGLTLGNAALVVVATGMRGFHIFARIDATGTTAVQTVTQ